MIRHAAAIVVAVFSTATVLGAGPDTAAARTSTVRAVLGDIVMTRTGAGSTSTTRLTKGGLDSEPVLAPAGDLVAFVRRVPGRTVEGPTGESDASEIWIVLTDGTGARRMVECRSADKPEANMTDFANLRFGLDGHALHFTTAAWATSGALKGVDIGTGKVRHMGPSNGFEIVPDGPRRGWFVNCEHRYYPAGGGAYDHFWLTEPSGKATKDLGDDLEKAMAKARRKSAATAGGQPTRPSLGSSA